MYKVVFKESVEKDFKKLPSDRASQIWTKIHKDLAAEPHKKGKALKGKWEGLRRYVSHPYRVIYSIVERDKTILVLRVRHRKEAYKR